MADRRRTGRTRTALFGNDTHAYRIHVQTEFLISPAASDPEVHWVGFGIDSIEGHWTIDFRRSLCAHLQRNPENEDIPDIGR
jgi:hypothetical protein